MVRGCHVVEGTGDVDARERLHLLKDFRGGAVVFLEEANKEEMKILLARFHLEEGVHQVLDPLVAR